MAILGDIRKRTGLLIGVIGVAMLAFVAGDIFSDQSVIVRLFTGDPNEVGNVDGESITVGEFLNAQNMMRSNPNSSQNQSNQQVWSSLVSNKLIESHANKAGIEISNDEVWHFVSRQYGMNVDELKLQIGQLKGQAEQGLPEAAQAYQNFLLMFESSKPDLLRQKYMNMVNMGVAVTHVEAKLQQASNIQSGTIDYGYVSYADLEKKYKVEITDNEIQNYINKYSKFFETEPTVELSYVYFVGGPSEEDENKVKESLNKLLTGTIEVDEINNVTDTIQAFASATNDSIYVNMYSESPFNSQFFSRKEIEQFKSQLPEDYYNFLMNSSLGEVGGPFKVGDTYQLVKLSETKEIPDSINSSHILISYSGTSVAQGNPAITRTREEARVLADSIKNMATAANFVNLVNEYSEDEGSKTKNGNIGWMSRTAQNLAPEYLQFLNTHKTGEIGITESQFGFHIIKIDGVKNQLGYQFASIIKEVRPSQETSDKNFSEARNFAQEIQGMSLNEFANAAQQKGYNYNSISDVERYYGQSIVERSTGVSNDQDDNILKWAFSKDAKVGSTNLFSTVNEDHIIVFVAAKNLDNKPSPKLARELVEPYLKKQKLVETVNVELGNQPTIDDFVSKFQAQRGSSSLTFGAASIEGKGPEPKVAGAAFGMKVGETSKAIEGREGVYVINLKRMADYPDVQDASAMQDQMQNQRNQEFQQQFLHSLIQSAEIKDNRMRVLDRQQF